MKHISIKINKSATSSFQIKYLYILKERQHYNYFSRLIYHFSLLYAIVKSTLSFFFKYWQPRINVCLLNISHLILKQEKELVIPTTTIQMKGTAIITFMRPLPLSGNKTVPNSKFWVCEWKPKVWTFKRKVLSGTFLWCCALCCNYWFRDWTFKMCLNLFN